MSLKRFATRRDTVEPAIVQALEAVGADVLRLDVFDLLCCYRGQLTMLDCKTGKQHPTASQARLVQRGWPLRFVRSAEEALQAIGITRT